MSEENNNPHEADLLDAMTLSPAEKQEYIAVAGSPKPADEKTASREDVIEALKTVCDPEIMINIWDMGLVYDMERTICDLLRSRKNIEMQVFQDALKQYAKRKDKNLRMLMKYAAMFHVEKILRPYLEVLL